MVTRLGVLLARTRRCEGVGLSKRMDAISTRVHESQLLEKPLVEATSSTKKHTQTWVLFHKTAFRWK
jgi:hypothetical protein